MPKVASIFSLLTLVFVLVAGSSGPASAKFWGCNDERGKVLSSRIISSPPGHWRARRHSGASMRYSRPRAYTHDFSAQSSRYRYNSRRNW